MRKSVVALLLALAIVVLVSPAIVGRLAEQSMHENLDWAARESQELVVTSQGFDRGWFSSEGQHRLEIQSGELQDMLLALAGSDKPQDIPALIIDTHLDHGLIPVASMSREEGTLMPGLGSAVSTLRVELANGETLQLPGTVYSNVSLTGSLQSKLILEEGAHEFEAADAAWGDTAISVVTHAGPGAISFAGQTDKLILTADDDSVTFDGIAFDGKLRKSRFGFSVGDANFAMQSMTVEGV
ncbi:MAG: YdgA family protein, partial [Gammaproteobacteria bacterium]|nr:YdgA family protein [Gammaproteobacteria bacterium]